MPAGDCIYYFEIKVKRLGKRSVESSVPHFGIGFCEEHQPLNCRVGQDDGSWGFHMDNGKAVEWGRGEEYSEPCAEGDVVGCGVDFRQALAFFTKMGKLLLSCSNDCLRPDTD